MEQKFERLEMRFDEVHERIDKVESSSQRGQPPIALNRQRRERNPSRFENEEDYGNDLEEEDRNSNYNLGMVLEIEELGMEIGLITIWIVLS